ncbi:hypothetical protein CL652_03175 [bacterium]|nr:hypothetical protein [bacterium]|tara:strand:+ start:3960 stop:4346 length:387 start_codon:yes stop_codon:yes gene_type:complete
MQYDYTKKTTLPFEDAVARIKETLAVEGFGVLTEIDVKATMKAKIGIDYDNYIILGACNPHFAHKALQEDKKIGLLLPCNVIVYEDSSDTYVSVILPSAAMSVVESEPLAETAKEVEAKLKRALDMVV